MAKTILVAGYGPGISTAVAEKFGAQGFKVAIVGRSAAKLGSGVEALRAKGVDAKSFTADLGDPPAVAAMVEEVRRAFGPISVLEWTAYTPGSVAGDLLTARPEEIHSLFDISVVGLLAAVQALLPDLKAEKGAILVTNGSAGVAEPPMDALCVEWGMMGLGLSNAAKHKLVGMLAAKLAADGIFVTEVTVAGVIKGTAFDNGQMPAIEGSRIAAKYWELYTGRKELRTTIQ